MKILNNQWLIILGRTEDDFPQSFHFYKVDILTINQNDKPEEVVQIKLLKIVYQIDFKVNSWNIGTFDCQQLVQDLEGEQIIKNIVIFVDRHSGLKVITFKNSQNSQHPLYFTYLKYPISNEEIPQLEDDSEFVSVFVKYQQGGLVDMIIATNKYQIFEIQLVYSGRDTPITVERSFEPIGNYYLSNKFSYTQDYFTVFAYKRKENNELMVYPVIYCSNQNLIGENETSKQSYALGIGPQLNNLNFDESKILMHQLNANTTNSAQLYHLNEQIQGQPFLEIYEISPKIKIQYGSKVIQSNNYTLTGFNGPFSASMTFNITEFHESFFARLLSAFLKNVTQYIIVISLLILCFIMLILFCQTKWKSKKKNSSQLELTSKSYTNERLKSSLHSYNSVDMVGSLIIGNGDKYRIEEKIGIGGYAVAYKVFSVSDKQIYAMKKINLEFLSKKDYNLQMEEAAKMQLLKSEFIIGLQSFFQIETFLYIVMDYADGGDLSALIENQKEKHPIEYFEEDQIWEYFYQICQGVCYCHAGGIIHRDLTPRNILLDKGECKITDFGISKQIKQSSQVSTQTRSWSINYQSPERVLGKEYGKQSDIWSLGCIIYELCSLEHPFAEDQLQKYTNILKGVYEPIPEHFSTEIKDLIKNMLRLDPAKRFTGKILLEKVSRKLNKTSILSSRVCTM